MKNNCCDFVRFRGARSAIPEALGAYLSRAGVLLMALALAACAGGSPKPTVDKVKATITASADVNPASDGRPSPLVVRIYQLKSEAKFVEADFFDLFEKDDQILGPDLVSRDEITLAPGETQELPLGVSDDARLLGVVAAYRDLRNSQWRVVKPAPKKGLKNLVKKDAITIQAQRAAVTLTITE
jgi:type VI secretion system protein VasD